MFVRRVIEDNDRAGGNTGQIMKNYLNDLLSQGLVTERDAEHLTQIIQIASPSSNERPVPPNELVPRLRRIYEGILDSDRSSPVAIMIASIAVDSAQSDTSAARGIFRRDVEGAFTGAGIGAGVGGVGGAVAGGLIGGILASVAEALDQRSAA
jgi:hypothetical protein